MSIPFDCDFDRGWPIEKECDGSVSNAPQPSEPTTPNFTVSVIRLVEVVIEFDTHFLLVFFPFRLAKPRIGRPQWLTRMYWPTCLYAFSLIFPQTTPMLLHNPSR